MAGWDALVSSQQFEVRFDHGDNTPHQVAFVGTRDREEASGLLRFSDAVGIPQEAEDETVATPPGLVPCGQIVVEDAAGSTAIIALFKSEPIDHRNLMKGAPITIHEPEDLDAREAWFKKRHGRDE